MAEQSLPNHHFLCKTCGIRFLSYRYNPQFCSKPCRNVSLCADVSFSEAVALYEKGHTHQEVGEMLNVKKHVITSLFRRNNYKSRPAKVRDQFGERSHQWKGDAAGYSALHSRVKKRFGTPKRCDHCCTTNPNIRYDWANLTGNYTDIHDFARLCVSCHARYDNRIMNFKWMKRHKGKSS